MYYQKKKLAFLAGALAHVGVLGGACVALENQTRIDPRTGNTDYNVLVTTCGQLDEGVPVEVNRFSDGINITHIPVGGVRGKGETRLSAGKYSNPLTYYGAKSAQPVYAAMPIPGFSLKPVKTAFPSPVSPKISSKNTATSPASILAKIGAVIVGAKPDKTITICEVIKPVDVFKAPTRASRQFAPVIVGSELTNDQRELASGARAKLLLDQELARRAIPVRIPAVLASSGYVLSTAMGEPVLRKPDGTYILVSDIKRLFAEGSLNPDILSKYRQAGGLLGLGALPIPRPCSPNQQYQGYAQNTLVAIGIGAVILTGIAVYAVVA